MHDHPIRSLALALLVALTSAAAQEPPRQGPTELKPIDPRTVNVPPLPSLSPAPVNDTDFVARTGDLLALARRFPAPAGDHTFKLSGLPYAPVSPVTGEALAVLQREAAPFDRRLRDQALACTARAPFPRGARAIRLELHDSEITVPVFLTPDSGELLFVELSLDKPGAPVVLEVRGYTGLALRIAVSKRTRLAAVHLQTYYPNVVLGVDPKLVTQGYYGKGRRAADCGYQESSEPAAGGDGKTEFYKSSGSARIAIGPAFAVEVSSPVLGQVLDLDMPAPHTYGILVLHHLGYVTQLSPSGRGSARPLPGGLEVRKPFRLPEGLYGGHAVSLLARPGGPLPSGNLGHSSLELLPR